MNYEDLATTYLVPLSVPIDRPTLPVTDARRLRDALEPIATQGWWSRPVGELLDGLGLQSFESYVWGRCAPLGVPEPATVVSAFGVLEPSLITELYIQAKAKVSREAILRARVRGATSAIASVVDDEEADAISRPLIAALASLDGMGRPLFCGLRALPLSDSAAGRLWQAAEMVREHRGDGHIAALVAADLDAVEANILTELWCGYSIGEYTQTRGFGLDVIEAAKGRLIDRGWIEADSLTEAGLAARLEIEAATDRSQSRLIARLGDGCQDVIRRAEAVSERLLEAQWFPPDPRKRAAG